MAKTKWAKYKSHQGPINKGSVKFNPAPPWGNWTKIMGVVARCEGNHDTVVMYDGTGVTFGYMQWTFTSGRLQKLLESLKSVPYYDFESESDVDNLFDLYCCNKGKQVFEKYGFKIVNGKFFDTALGKPLDPRKHKKRIVDVCLGKTLHKTFKRQRSHAIALANLFVKLGGEFGVPEVQISFAKDEFKRHLNYKRRPLGKIRTIRKLLGDSWDTPLPALFFNLWQNNPGAAYRLFIRAGNNASNVDEYFELAWRYANRSRFGNWGWGKPGNKSPRVARIKKAIKEFYGINLPYHK